MAGSALLLAVFNLRGGEIFLILVLVLLLFCAKRLPDFSQGLAKGLFEFWKATRELTDAIDNKASDAGESAAGIYGKRAAQALTPDNRVAELYTPSVFDRGKSFRRKGKIKALLRRIWQALRVHRR